MKIGVNLNSDNPNLAIAPVYRTRRLVKYFRDKGYDVVTGENIGNCKIDIQILTSDCPIRQTDIPTIFWCSVAPYGYKHGEIYGGGIEKRSFNIMKKHFEVADYIVYQCKYCRTLANKMYGKKDGEIIFPGIATGKHIHKQKDKEVITLVNQYWYPQKRFWGTVDVLRQYRNEKKGKVEVKLLGHIVQPGVNVTINESWIHHTIHMRHPQLFKMYDECDFLVFFGYRDLSSLTVVEAVGHGLPVVIANSGGVKDIVCNAAVIAETDGTLQEQEEKEKSFNLYNDFPPLDKDICIKALHKMSDNLKEMQLNAAEKAKSLELYGPVGFQWEKVLIKTMEKRKSG